MTSPDDKSIDVEIREGKPGDWQAIQRLYPAAFPEEDLLPLLEELLKDESLALSLVAIAGSSLVGQIAFTRCDLENSSARPALLGPLAVDPALHGGGLGSALVREGLARLAAMGFTHVFVLGDPAYYSRFGFAPEEGVSPPYDLPKDWAEAWQSLALDEADPLSVGRLSAPGPWRHRALWAP